MNTRKIYKPSKRAAHIPAPGKIIASELEARGWHQRDLAEIIGRSPTKISDIIHARRDITIETAKDLEAAFQGTSAQFWMNLQTAYSLAKSTEQAKIEDTKQKAQLYSLLPVAELQKRGYLPKDINKLIAAALQFLGISSLAEEVRFAASFRISECVQVEQNHIKAWYKIIEQKASQMVDSMPAFNSSSLNACKDELLALTASAEGISNVHNILQKYGIIFVVEKHLPKTGIDGIAFEWQGHPVIGLSLRYDRIDSFWFTLLHELAHCMNQDYSCCCDFDCEDQANKMAQEWLVPEEKLHTFLKINTRLSFAAVRSFAMSMNRHVSIILGQLKRKKKLNHAFAAKEHGKASRYLTHFC